MKANLIPYEIHTFKGVNRYKAEEYRLAMVRHLNLVNTKKRPLPLDLQEYVDTFHDSYRNKICKGGGIRCE